MSEHNLRHYELTRLPVIEKVPQQRHREPVSALATDNRQSDEAKSLGASKAAHSKASLNHKQQPVVAHYDQADKLHSFNTTMHHTRRQLFAAERSFSKILHQPALEKISDVTSKTIARPSGILGASLVTFVGLFLTYGTARFAGFELSGSEMPVFITIGFFAGLFTEWLFKAARSLFAPKTF